VFKTSPLAVNGKPVIPDEVKCNSAVVLSKS
jgi:hypothetical protein